MKVFLSHAISDKNLVNSFKKNCQKYGLELLVAEHSTSVSQTITSKIEDLIKQSNIAVFLLTEKGDESKFVHQEIGYIKSINKAALYIVEKGKNVTGFAYGRDFIELDSEKPDMAIKKAIKRLLTHWEGLKAIEQREKENAGIFIAGLIALALFAE